MRTRWVACVLASCLIACGDDDGASSDAPISVDGAIDAPAATIDAPAFTLTVNTSGEGAGVVRSTPVGIDCGSDCSEAFAEGSVVTLTPEAAQGSRFAEWSGACTSLADCVVAVSQPISVEAAFIPETCEAFTAPDGTTVPGWSERGGDWVVDDNQIRNTVSGRRRET